MDQTSPPVQQPGHIPSWELPQAKKAIEQTAPSVRVEPSSYYLPLSQTLRLYAGWLLAWYGFVYLLGSLQMSGLAPWAPEFIGNLFQSPLTLFFAYGTYLFLLLGTIHRSLGGGVLKGLLLLVAGILLFWAFWEYA